MRRPLRVLFTIPNLVTAGSGRALYEVARRLDRRVVEPAVCVAWRGRPQRGDDEAPGAERALERLFVDSGIPVVEAPTTVPARPLWRLPARLAAAAHAVRAATRAIAPTGFDIWHSYHYLDDYTEPLVARLAGARWVYTKKNMSWNARSWWLRSVLAHGIAAQNNDMLARFFSGRSFAGRRLQARTVLLPRGVDTERFRPPTKEQRRAARAAFGAEDNELVVGCVAQLVPVKGHDILLDAFARLRATQPAARLLLAGGPLDGEVADRLRRQIETLELGERVRLLGRVDDVPRLLHALDVCVLPTRATGEGRPVALLEALSSGVASIATDVAGSRDVLNGNASAEGAPHGEDGGESPGLLVPAEDPEALASALESLLADQGRREWLGAVARRAARTHHPIELEVERHERFYRRVAGARRAEAGRSGL